MKRFFHLYQYAGPAVLTPLAALLWLRHYDGNWQLAALAVLVPVLHAYVVPGIGTNILKMWAFNTKLRLGKFRPHHGFVFGSATAVISLPFAGAAGDGQVWRTALFVGMALLAINWIYDALALKAGFLEVYNQPHADGAGPWAVSADYVVWFFGVFGIVYGGGLKLAEQALLADPAFGTMLACTAALVAATVVVPSALYVLMSFVRHGHSGCRPVTSQACQ